MDFERLNQRDRQAWEVAFPELVARARGKVNSYNKSQCKSAIPKETIEELAVEAVVMAYRHPEPFKNEGHLIGFIVLVALNLTRDYAKSAFGRRQIQGQFKSVDNPLEQEPFSMADETAPSPSELHDHSEFLAIARDLLKKAASADYELLMNRFAKGMTESEIGEKYGWGTSSVHSRIQQACKRVREVLTSDPRASNLLKELGFGDYFDE